MGEPENRRQREAMLAMLRPHVDEDVLSGQWFKPAKAMEDDGLRAFRFLRRHLSDGDHIAERIRGWNVLALTPTRLIAFTARPVRSTPPVEVKKQIGEWQRERVVVSFRGRKATSHFHGSGNSWAYSSKIVRASLRFDGHERPLVIDFPEMPLTRELLKAAAGQEA